MAPQGRRQMLRALALPITQAAQWEGKGPEFAWAGKAHGDALHGH